VATCSHCGDSGAEKTVVKVERLLRSSTNELHLCRDCYAALVEYVEHGDVAEPEEDDEDEDEDDDDEDDEEEAEEEAGS